MWGGLGEVGRRGSWGTGGGGSGFAALLQRTDIRRQRSRADSVSNRAKRELSRTHERPFCWHSGLPRFALPALPDSAGGNGRTARWDHWLVTYKEREVGHQPC